jgi:hypothetical protein
MANTEINIVGILRPKPGKMDRVSFPLPSISTFHTLLKTHFQQLLELLSTVANRIRTEEKDISRFSVSREVDTKTKEQTNTLVLIET